ncbi:MAG: Cna B-type domain-containing protein, partial [Methanobrevibacter sp.]|nr:Cna B-type domain-containing protein [Methanobrevibacter sp.]
MKLNKLMNVLLITFVLIMVMGAVSAADNLNAVGTDNGNLEVEHNADVLKASDNGVLGDGNTGNSWYVKAGATGGDGSEASPYANVKQVTNNANYKENDTIYVMDGTYTGSSNYDISLKENTTITAYNGAEPIFDANEQKSIFVISNNGIVIKGLTLINGGGSVFQTAENNNAWCGGAIVNSGDNLLVENCTIKSNDPISYGGGIYSKGYYTEIRNCTFDHCDADYGGAIAIDGPYAKIVNNTFMNNFGKQGGAINIYNYGGTLIANNSFNGNYASRGYGGAIYARAGKNDIVNSTFYRNTAKTYGGAIITVNPDTKIDNCTFISNKIFNENSGTNWGGAIYTQGENTQIVNSRFKDNAVRDNGGAICIRNNDNLVENCTFDGNWAARGGAIYVHSIVSGHNITDTVINNCTFNGNGVISEQDGEPDLGTKGGAIYSWGIDTNITNSEFNNNLAMEGGAVLFERGHNFMENNTFIANKAVRYGGGAISSTRFGDTINNCTFKNNFAKGYGGAVSADYPTITNSKFIDNHANHGGAICTITANVSNCEFYKNSADDNWVVLAATKLIESNNIHPGQVALSMNHIVYLNMDYDVDNEIAIMPGYYAYCMEEYADYPQYGVLWENLRFAQNSLSEEPIGEYVKILIFKYWNNESQHSNLQKLVNVFTDHDYLNSDNPTVQEIIALHDSGYRVPTNNAVRFYDNGTVAIFNFREIITPSATQNVFAFNITYNPNLTVEKEVITNPVFDGKQVDFNITVNNTGKCNLTYVWINETDFSDGLKYVSFKSSFNWTYDNKTKIWTLTDTLSPNKTAYIILTFNVTKSGNMTNNVSVGIGNYSFGNDTVNFTVYRPNMTVEKIALDKRVYIGNETTFTIVVKNTGDYKLTDIKVFEEIPKGLRFDGKFDGYKWFNNKNEFIYLGILEPGKSTSFNITFTAISEGNWTNRVNATSNETENKSSSNTTEVLKPIVINIAKVWDDNNNQDGVRPTSVVVELLADGTVIKNDTLSESNGWKCSFKDLVIYNDQNKTINYTIREKSVVNYTCEITDDGKYNFTVKNNHTPAVTDVKVIKVWNDNNNQDGVRPVEVTVVLVADGNVISNKTLNASNKWSASFSDLPVYSNGKLVKYSVEELKVANYTCVVSSDAEYSFVVNNTHVPVVTDVSVAKVWDDNNNQDGVRPVEVTVVLLGDGNVVGT